MHPPPWPFGDGWLHFGLAPLIRGPLPLSPRHSTLRSALLGATASVLMHVVIYAWLQTLPAAAARAADSDRRRLIELPAAAFAELGPAGRQRREPAPPEPGGPRSAQNVDGEDRGRGGEVDGAVSFTLLVDRAHPVNLQDSPLNSADAAQTQRIRTARDRAAWENRRRATPNPEDEYFLASGSGRHRERRPVDARDAAHGARLSPGASTLGSRQDRPGFAGDHGGAGPSVVGFAAEGAGSPSRAGADRDTPSRGVLRGRAERERAAADVAHGRPAVDRGPATTTAQSQGRVRDDTDAELLAAQLLQSVVDSSRRRGQRAGEGNGGVGGGGDPGSGGGEEAGGRASPYGPGDGRFGALDTSDPRYVRWYVNQRRRVNEALRFPRERALAMDQGLTVVVLRVNRDGTLAAAPRRKRSSGFDDFDREALRAIRSVAPFEPLPSNLVPGREVLQLDMTVDFQNPMIR